MQNGLNLHQSRGQSAEAKEIVLSLLLKRRLNIKYSFWEESNSKIIKICQTES